MALYRGMFVSIDGGLVGRVLARGDQLDLHWRSTNLLANSEIAAGRVRGVTTSLF